MQLIQLRMKESIKCIFREHYSKTQTEKQCGKVNRKVALLIYSDDEENL